MTVDPLDEDTLATRAELLTALGTRLEQFAASRQQPTQALRSSVYNILSRYADVRPTTSIKPGTPLARYFDARRQVLRASVRARLVG